MKYLNFCSSASKLESISCKFTKSYTLSQVFFQEFHYKCRTAILKNASRCCFWRQLHFRKIPQWLLLKDSCKDIFILEILGTHVLHFLLWGHVKEERIFMNIFLSEGFGEKCKHTEVALNFIQKQYFS